VKLGPRQAARGNLRAKGRENAGGIPPAGNVHFAAASNDQPGFEKKLGIQNGRIQLSFEA
jgi:hypothetical protein